jgi:hypothetical protein
MTRPLDSMQSAADEAITSWPGVKGKQVFGHRGYVRDGHMFAFIAESGLAFKAVTLGDAELLYESGQAVPFVYRGSMEMRGWPVVPLGHDSDLAAALSAAHESYHAAE